MKKKDFIVTLIIFGILFLFFCVFKFLSLGNNKIIGDVNDLDKFILSIENYNACANISVYSNKNSNTYRLNQSCRGGITTQEIDDGKSKIVIICDGGNKLTIKNTVLPTEKVFEVYSEACNNSIGLDAFIEDYKADSNSEIKEENGYFVVSVKAKNSQNRYSKSKVLYFNKEKRRIEKIVVKDINNNDVIIIEYSTLEIL